MDREALQFARPGRFLYIFIITHYATLVNCYVTMYGDDRLKEIMLMDVMRIVFEVEVEGLGQALRQAREKAKLSVASAGERAGMSGANFSRIENEETKGVPIETLVKAAKAVGLDLSSYLGEWVKSMPGITIEKGDNNV